MAQEKLLELLRRVQEGTVSPEQAVLELKVSPFEDLGYAKVDSGSDLWERKNRRTDSWHRFRNAAARQRKYPDYPSFG